MDDICPVNKKSPTHLDPNLPTSVFPGRASAERLHPTHPWRQPLRSPTAAMLSANAGASFPKQL
jgi:hypothetical protein